MKKTRIAVLIGTLIILLGMSMTQVSATTPTTFPVTITGTIENDVWGQYIGSVDFEEDFEVYMILQVEDPIPELDIDFQVYSPEGEIVLWAGAAYGTHGDPAIIELGYFWAPIGGTYDIYMDGYYVPYPEGVEYTLYIDSAEEMYDCIPLESNGMTSGQLTSYVNCHPNAKLSASDKAGFADVAGNIEGTHINFQNAFVTNAWTPYTLTPMMFCVDDPLIVGGIVWELPAYFFDTYLEAKEYMNLDYKNYIDGVPLSDLAKVKTGSVRPVYYGGERISYTKLLETAVFKSGELAELIGTGMHLVEVWLVGPDFEFPIMWFYFWLEHEGWTGPH